MLRRRNEHSLPFKNKKSSSQKTNNPFIFPQMNGLFLKVGSKNYVGLIFELI